MILKAPLVDDGSATPDPFPASITAQGELPLLLSKRETEPPPLRPQPHNCGWTSFGATDKFSSRPNRWPCSPSPAVLGWSPQPRSPPAAAGAGTALGPDRIPLKLQRPLKRAPLRREFEELSFKGKEKQFSKRTPTRGSSLVKLFNEKRTGESHGVSHFETCHDSTSQIVPPMM